MFTVSGNSVLQQANSENMNQNKNNFQEQLWECQQQMLPFFKKKLIINFM